MVKILKDGDRFAIITNEANAYLFFDAMAKEVAKIIDGKVFENDIGFQLESLFEIIPEICSFYQNYKISNIEIFGQKLQSGMRVL